MVVQLLDLFMSIQICDNKVWDKFLDGMDLVVFSDVDFVIMLAF